MELQEFFALHPKAALALSGGVDSAYLLYAAVKCGANVRPYYVKSQFQPQFEYEDAARLCRELGAEMRVLDLDILSDESITTNPENRCYF
ncbi:MAG: 7-cyano-7-deazaguanine synthase, partial [Oscillospiraceae bacterium]|nr:7-cyano-7-deazaguanine synthase [Oscillospiraceae bacterium]